MISAEQIRGARGILNWTQDALAHECGLSPNTIYNLERGYANRSSVVVRTTLEKKGIQFHGDSGVSIRKDDQSITFSGNEGTQRFYDDVVATIKEQGGDIVTMYPTIEALMRSLGIDNAKDLGKLKKLSNYATVRCLLWDEKDALEIPGIQLRATTHQLPRPLSSFTYGNKHALALSANGKSYFYYVALSAELARCDLNHFEGLWLNGTPLRVKR